MKGEGGKSAVVWFGLVGFGLVWVGGMRVCIYVWRGWVGEREREIH